MLMLMDAMTSAISANTKGAAACLLVANSALIQCALALSYRPAGRGVVTGKAPLRGCQEEPRRLARPRVGLERTRAVPATPAAVIGFPEKHSGGSAIA
jgi:hypothetical protein